jgi:hypothetical protein
MAYLIDTIRRPDDVAGIIDGRFRGGGAAPGDNPGLNSMIILFIFPK